MNFDLPDIPESVISSTYASSSVLDQSFSKDPYDGSSLDPELKTRSLPSWVRAKGRTAGDVNNVNTTSVHDKKRQYAAISAKEGVPYETVIKDQPSQDSQIPSSADVVIIGGGSIGCNTLYHLTKLGVKNAVLLEKDKLTAGTTWHTAGLVWQLRPSDIEIQLLRRTHDLLQTLEEETGVNPGWINNGGLFIASTKERLDEYKRLMTIGKAFNIESHVLDPQETKKLYPLLNVNDVYGTLYSPADGTVDPAGFCTSLTRGAAREGAKVIENCSVNGIETAESLLGHRIVTGVNTSKGFIKTNCIVNCTGVWAPQIGQMAGVKVPLIVIKHAYVVTEKIPGIQNMPNVRDHDASVYLKLQGDALCVGGYENNPVFWEDVPKDFSFGLFELDWEVFGINITGAVNRVPVLEQTGIKSTVCGPESFTPDHKPLLGEEPTLRGFFHGCGFNSAGMMLGGGCGWQLAEWVVKGRPSLDMYSYDIRRFNPKMTDNVRWIKERSHEAYAKNYSIVYPNDEPLAARDMIRDPLHDVLAEQGCIFQQRHGWERPGWFSTNGPAVIQQYDWYGAYGHSLGQNQTYVNRLKDDYTFEFPKQHETIKNECLSCRNSAAVFNMSYFGKFYITGPDAQKAADWIFANQMNADSGKTVYTCMLNESAGVEADLTVSVITSGSGSPCDPKFEGKGFYLAAGGGSAYQNWSHVLKAVQDKNFKVNLLDHSGDMCLLSLQGPKSRDILQQLDAEVDFSNEGFPFSTHQLLNIGGHKCRALRVSFVGELGWELHVPNESAVAVYQAIMEVGKLFGVVNAGYRAMDSLSIEKGYRHWHMDLRPDDDPLEAGLGFTCKLKTNTEFQGRVELEKRKASGLMKKLVCFTIDERVPLWGLEAIWRDDQVVGYLRRADFGFALDKSIGYGYVRHPEGQPVTLDYLRQGNYQLESMGVKLPATLHTKTPFDSNGHRLKGCYDAQ
nr:EOG090X014D [Triops cancriformis]